jgi:hypothetical protein
VTGFGGDRGDIVLGFLTKLVVVMAIVGLVGFDLMSLLISRMKVEDRAASAARAAVRAWDETKDVQRSYDAASRAVDESGDAAAYVETESFSVGTDGSVTVTVHHEASTLLVEKIGPIRDWASSTATTTARPVR